MKTQDIGEMHVFQIVVCRRWVSVSASEAEKLYIKQTQSLGSIDAEFL